MSLDRTGADEPLDPRDYSTLRRDGDPRDEPLDPRDSSVLRGDGDPRDEVVARVRRERRKGRKVFVNGKTDICVTLTESGIFVLFYCSISSTLEIKGGQRTVKRVPSGYWTSSCVIGPVPVGSGGDWKDAGDCL